MKSGIDVDPVFMRLPNRPPAGAEIKEGTAPAWRREMERAQMEAWLGHPMVGFASPAQQVSLLPAEMVAIGKRTEPLAPPTAGSGFHAVVLPTHKTGDTGEQHVQTHTRAITVDGPVNRTHQPQGAPIDSPSQVQVSATSVNGRDSDQASMVPHDHTRASRESRDQPPTINNQERTEQLISLLQSLGTTATTNSEEQRGFLDGASQVRAPAMAGAPSASIGSEPAMLTRWTAALTDYPGTLIAAPQLPGNPANLPTATAMRGGVLSHRAGQEVRVDGAEPAANMAGSRSGAPREPIRLHADWSAEGVRLWLGMDASHFGSVELINAQLQRWLSTQGLKLLSMSVNGRVVEQAHQKNDFDVYEAEIERARAAAPDVITPF